MLQGSNVGTEGLRSCERIHVITHEGASCEDARGGAGDIWLQDSLQRKAAEY